ncbi:MAG: Glu-tRNA(Gln) amidotransferase subunit GatE [Thermoproteota archaeon]
MVDPKLDLNKIDVKSLGIRVGLEVHQQLDTRHKLFCSCPTKASHQRTHAKILRQLRPTRSELGEVDVAALFEWRRGRLYEYDIPADAACLVEADEEPPHSLNREAVTIAAAIAMALGSHLVDEVYVMRKIVIDGSNTTGFQRTAIVALGGSLKLPSGKTIGIQSIAVEEDAARKVGERGRLVTYNLDRLGIPLIEIATEPEINSPEEAYEAALTIGQLLRLTKRVKRGIGTIRQDLNVSIKGGAKIEIKGVQTLEALPKIVLYEAVRQYRLLQIRDELARRRVDEKTIRSGAKIADVTDIFRDTNSKVIKRALSMRGRVLALSLPGFSGLLKVEVQPGRRFGTELADYARFWGGVGGIFHSDELPAYGISEEELIEVYKALGADRGRDAVVIVADEYTKARSALEAVLERSIEALKGIPRETRAALSDGTTRYMRPQPGSARMYPETDVPPLLLDDSIISEAMKIVPPHPVEKLNMLRERYSLSEELAKVLLTDVRLDLFEELAERYGKAVAPSFIASVIVNTLRGLGREGVPVENIDDSHIEEVIRFVAEGKLAKDAVADVLAYIARNPEARVKDAIRELGIEVASTDYVEQIVEKVIAELRDEIEKRGERAYNKIMGRVMSILRGKADGRLVADIVKKKLQQLIG